MSTVSAARVSTGATIDCSHVSKRSSSQGIHRETDAANGIAMPYITFVTLPVKQAKKTPGVPNLPTPSPPRVATDFAPSPEALKFLSALFYKSHIPLQHAAPCLPGTSVTNEMVGASCSTYVEPERQLSLLSYQLETFDINNVQLEWSALQAYVSSRNSSSGTDQANPTHKRADTSASLNQLEHLKKQLTRSRQIVTTPVKRKALSTHRHTKASSNVPLPITHSSFPLIDYPSATPSQGSDVSSVFSDSGQDDSRSESSGYSVEDKIPQNQWLSIEIPTNSIGIIEHSSGSGSLAHGPRPGGDSVPTNGEIVEPEARGMQWVVDSLRNLSIIRESLMDDKRRDKNIIPTPNAPAIPPGIVEAPRLSLDLAAGTVIAGPDPILRDYIPSPLLNSKTMQVSLSDTWDITIPGLVNTISELEAPDEETTLSVGESLTCTNSYQNSPMLNEQEFPIKPSDAHSEEIFMSLESCEPFSQTCETPGDDEWGTLAILRLPPYHEVNFAQTTPIFDSGEPCTPICRVQLPSLAVNDSPAHDLSLSGLLDKNGDDNPIDIEVRSKRQGVTLDIEPTPLEDIDAGFRARGWSVGGSWQDDEELEEFRPPSVPTNTPSVPDRQNSRFGNICKNLNMTRASGGFYRWSGGS